MRPRHPTRVACALLACAGVACAVRGILILQHPLLQPDVPAYVRAAEGIGRGEWRDVLGGYYPPMLPALMEAVHVTTGLGREAAGRAVSGIAGVVAVVVIGILGVRVLGPRVGVAAALLAAVHTHLVRGSVAVLPEMLFGLLVACWALLLLVPGGTLRVAVGAVTAAVACTARVEGLALVPLSVLVAWVVAPPGRRARHAAIAAVVGVAVVGPWLVFLRVATGAWAISGKETAIVARRWAVEESTLAHVLLAHPGAVLASYPGHLARQISYTASVVLIALLPFLAVGIGVRLPTAAARRARALALLVVATFTLAIAVLNPGKRYVVALLPLLLPWIATGSLTTISRLRRGASNMRRWVGPAVAAGVVALAVHAAVPESSRWRACFPRVCAWLEARYGTPLPPIMVRDGRVAYLCDAPYVHEPRRTGARRIATMVGPSGARVWLLKESRRPARMPPEVRLVDALCEGRARLLAFEPTPDDGAGVNTRSGDASPPS